jgi:hypothetical protein
VPVVAVAAGHIPGTLARDLPKTNENCRDLSRRSDCAGRVRHGQRHACIGPGLQARLTPGVVPLMPGMERHHPDVRAGPCYRPTLLAAYSACAWVKPLPALDVSCWIKLAWLNPPICM